MGRWDEIEVGDRIESTFEVHKGKTGTVIEIDRSERLIVQADDQTWPHLMRLPTNGKLGWCWGERTSVKLIAKAQTAAHTTKRPGMLAPTIDKTEAAVYAFFTAPRPGNCACDIPPPCKYHPR